MKNISKSVCETFYVKNDIDVSDIEDTSRIDLNFFQNLEGEGHTIKLYGQRLVLGYNKLSNIKMEWEKLKVEGIAGGCSIILENVDVNVKESDAAFGVIEFGCRTTIYGNNTITVGGEALAIGITGGEVTIDRNATVNIFGENLDGLIRFWDGDLVVDGVLNATDTSGEPARYGIAGSSGGGNVDNITINGTVNLNNFASAIAMLSEGTTTINGKLNINVNKDHKSASSYSVVDSSSISINEPHKFIINGDVSIKRDDIKTNSYSSSIGIDGNVDLAGTLTIEQKNVKVQNSAIFVRSNNFNFISPNAKLMTVYDQDIYSDTNVGVTAKTSSVSGAFWELRTPSGVKYWNCNSDYSLISTQIKYPPSEYWSGSEPVYGGASK